MPSGGDCKKQPDSCNSRMKPGTGFSHSQTLFIFKMKSIVFKFAEVALIKIDSEDRLTDFLLTPAPGSLKDSIDAIGVIHPVILNKTTGGYKVVSGHRRVDIVKMLGLKEISARVTESDLDPETLLALNLMENRSHRTYSDIEKGRIIHKLVEAGVSEKMIIEKYMPILGIARSKKLFQDFSCVPCFSTDLQVLLHEMNVPIRVFSCLQKWSVSNRDTALKLFSVLRPGVNKWRELLELAEEIARIENTSPGDIFKREEIQSTLAQTDIQAHEKYDQIVQTLTPLRYPVLHDLRVKIARVLDQLSLGPRTKIRVHESFETEEIKIEIKGRDQKSLTDEVGQLANAVKSPAMEELLRILRRLK